ncbi:MAG TPA: hypothetical protein VJU82_06475 [Acidobacteriaceae bacterium]|nr:hypothetical protein [Acidobacteriaceae bacterium]
MRRVLVLLAGVLCFWGIASYSEAQDEDTRPPRNGPLHPGVTLQEMSAVRPLAMADLRRALSAGGEPVDARYLREEFRRCKFRHLALGTLGTAVMMAYQDPGAAPNGGMYDIYLRRGGRYEKIVESGGFGPYMLADFNGIPDLAFGATTGVCTESFVRLRYKGGRYQPNACIQNVRDNGSDSCHIQACDDARHLPTFPEPDPAALQ